MEVGKMASSLVILLFASTLVPSSVASSVSSTQTNYFGATGCGPANVEFEVKTDNGQHDMPAVDSGKAMIVFLQDDAMFGARPRPTTRFGIDGTWVGATHANSYFYVLVDPGEHHLCANWQSHAATVGVPTRSTAAAHFIAEAGKTYYFQAWDIGIADRGPGAEVRLELLDSDEAQVLVRTFDFSSSRPKK
jgi:hypothetical protein